MKLSTIFYGLMSIGCMYLAYHNFIALITTGASLPLLGIFFGVLGALCYGYIIYERYKEGNL